jgi:SAM-dependent methyltransferase
MTLPPVPEVIELDDAVPREAWNTYERSGIGTYLRGHHVCLVLSALDRLGIAEQLRADGPHPLVELTAGLNDHVARHVVRWLELRGIVDLLPDGLVETTAHGRDLFSSESMAILGYFTDAYGELTHNVSGLLDNSLVYGKDIARDGAAVGHHHGILYQRYHADTVRHAMGDREVTCILDLGCGSGQTLIDECQLDPDLRGVGLDISPEVIDLARGRSQALGLSDRLQFVVADAFKPDVWPDACREADAVLALGVLHEHFRDGEDAVVAILDKWAAWFPRELKLLLIGEGELVYDGTDNDADFYLVHTLSAQGFPRYRDEWLPVIDRSKLRIRRIYVQEQARSLPRMVYYDMVPATALSDPGI